MKDSCILGININGLSVQTEVLDFKSSRANYDYICNVNLYANNNGNGGYYINITNQDFVSGCLIAGWKIDSCSIGFDWGVSECYFKLTDKNGISTDKIIALTQKGTASGFKIEAHAKAIFPKAIDIISKFPSAEVYDLYSTFSKLTLFTSDIFKFRKKIKPEDYLNSFFEESHPHIGQIISCYRRLETILSYSSDERSKILMNEVRSKVYKFIKINFGD